jgi:hypothetical protein
LVAAWYGHSASGAANTWTAPQSSTRRVSVNNGGSRSSLGADRPQASIGPSEPFVAAASVFEDYAITHLLALKPK